MARPASIVRGGWLIALAGSVTLFTSLGAHQPPAAAPGQPPAAPAGRREQPAAPAGRGEQAAAPAGRGEQPAAPAPEPLVPVATNTVNANPAADYGPRVTRTASGEQILSKSAFAVDQKRMGGAAPAKPTDVLVLVPTLQSPVDPKSYVTVMGELVKFDPAEVAKKAKDYKIDLPPDVVAKYTGRPAMIATSKHISDARLSSPSTIAATASTSPRCSGSCARAAAIASSWKAAA